MSLKLMLLDLASRQKKLGSEHYVITEPALAAQLDSSLYGIRKEERPSHEKAAQRENSRSV